MAARSRGGNSMAMTACFAGPLFNMLVGTFFSTRLFALMYGKEAGGAANLRGRCSTCWCALIAHTVAKLP